MKIEIYCHYKKIIEKYSTSRKKAATDNITNYKNIQPTHHTEEQEDKIS
jgi:hypothetical protein